MSSGFIDDKRWVKSEFKTSQQLKSHWCSKKAEGFPGERKGFQKSSGGGFREQESPALPASQPSLALLFHSLRSLHFRQSHFPPQTLKKCRYYRPVSASVPVTWQFLLPSQAFEFERFEKKERWVCSGRILQGGKCNLRAEEVAVGP